LQRERHNECPNLQVKEEKAQLEVELMKPKWYNYGDLGC